jgi:hypothetical protein
MARTEDGWIARRSKVEEANMVKGVVTQVVVVVIIMTAFFHRSSTM